MRYSNLFGKTLREMPRNAGPIGQQLLLRAGFIKSSGGGSFIVLPLARRVLRHADGIISSEAEARGVQFLEFPPVVPGVVKERAAGAELKRALAACRPEIRRQYPMAAQHEDDLCLLAGSLPMTYKELPLRIGSIQWKYREESRGQASVVSSRQFPAHAAYSFDAGEASARESYDILREACLAAFRRIGIEVITAGTRPAPPGTVGSEEFMALSEAGDREIAVCDSCEYRAGFEMAQSLFPGFQQEENPRPMEAVYGPGIVGTSELAAFVGIPVEKTSKTLLFQADDAVVAVCVRGEYDVSEAKLAGLLGCAQLKLTPAGVVKDLTGADVGYAGPIGLPEEIRTVWDLTAAGRVNFEAGANRTDYHYINLNFDRDAPRPQEFVDVRQVKEGETCAKCGRGRLVVRKATGLGHVSHLGAMYSKELKAAYTSRGGKQEPMLLTCCGIDMMRLLAAIVEQHSDKKGILWPTHIAPFAAHLISLPGVEGRAEELYHRLLREGIDLLWDDRDTPAGAKFGDADLIGIPVRLVVSARTGENVEWKKRGSEGADIVPVEEAIRRMLDLR